MPTFHTILRLQREIRVGRYHQVLSLLNREREAVVPPGMFFLSAQSLAFIFLVYGAAKTVGTNYMLDALTPGPYAQLFMMAGMSERRLRSRSHRCLNVVFGEAERPQA